MSYPNKETAFPTVSHHIGLTKLEFAAIQIAQAAASRTGISWTPEEVSDYAVQTAVQIFKRTDKE